MKTIKPIWQWRSIAVAALSLLFASCADDGGNGAPPSRIGEACSATQPCQADLACLETQLRCVILCEPGSEDCGVGIECQSAGNVGFCPLPPPAQEN